MGVDVISAGTVCAGELVRGTAPRLKWPRPRLGEGKGHTGEPDRLPARIHPSHRIAPHKLIRIRTVDVERVRRQAEATGRIDRTKSRPETSGLRRSARTIHLTGRNARATLGVLSGDAAGPRRRPRSGFGSCFNRRYHNTPIIKPRCIASTIKIACRNPRKVCGERFPLHAPVISHRFSRSRAFLGAIPVLFPTRPEVYCPAPSQSMHNLATHRKCGELKASPNRYDGLDPADIDTLNIKLL